jgi:hypothetical protein
MENTPSNILRVPYVNAIFPEAIWLFMTRNPFSCISSMDLKWHRPKTMAGLRRTISVTPPSQLPYYAGDFLRHVVLKRLFKTKTIGIYGPRYRGIDQDLAMESRMKVVARQWAVCNRRAREDLAVLGRGRVLSFTYENLIADPSSTVRRIYAHCGLSCTDEIAARAQELVDPGRQQKWRRLDPEQLRHVVPELADEMAQYGYRVPLELA